MPGAGHPLTCGRELRLTFEEVPELYDRARPTYPAKLFEDLAAVLPPRADVLEIGCGTGKATIALAARGCVELGEQLAAVARRNLAGFEGVDIAVADFETWPVDRRFHAVVAFSAFHWIEPALRYERAAAVLRKEGVLAVTNVKHVLGDDGDPFFVDVQEDYRAVVPDEDDGPPPRPDDVPDLAREITASGWFDHVAAHRYVWDVVCTADEYLDVLDTYSGHRSMEVETRLRLFERIGDGTVRKTYLATLDVARINAPSSPGR